MPSAPEPRNSIERQLFSNQLWETVAFAAKAVFMLGLTPWMLSVWGADGYGEFALAGSTFVLLTILDFGIRPRARVALCQATTTAPDGAAATLSQSVATFGGISACAVLLAAGLTWSGVLDRVFALSASSHYLLLWTTIMSLLVSMSLLLLEPLVATGRIGHTKMAAALGWLLAIAGVAVCLHQGAAVTTAVCVWLTSLLGANLFALSSSGENVRHSFRGWALVGFRRAAAIVREGFWFNATNTTWLTRSYGSTLLISAIDGPVMAGSFFVLLRLSEVISAVGAISTDVSLGAIAQGKTVEARRDAFLSSYSWAVLLCTHGALVTAFLAAPFLSFWLHPATPLSPLIGVVVAALGLGSALNRIATYAAMAQGLGRTAATWGVVEAIAFVGAIVLVPESYGLPLRLGIGSLSALAIVPVVLLVASRLGGNVWQVWLRPFGRVVRFAGVSALLLGGAALSGRPLWMIVAVALCGLLALANIRWHLANLRPLSTSAATLAPLSHPVC